MTNDRQEDLLINAIEWAINCSEQVTHDLLRGMRITSEELEEIGYDKENFTELHSYVIRSCDLL